MTHDHDDLVRLNVAAKELGLAPKTVKAWCKAGRLVCTKLANGQWRVKRSSLDDAQQITSPNRPSP